MRALVPLAVVVSLSACDGLLPQPDLERMIDQQKVGAYEETPLLPGGSAMQPPPPGTVQYAPPARRLVRAAHPEIGTGMDVAARDVTVVPLPLTRDLLERGETQFEIVCATCHGPRGDGQSEVARHMELRKPPTLLDAPVRSFSAGRIFKVISDGYGLMPGYARDLPAEDRWAIIGYLRALELSQNVSLDALPAALRRTVVENLP